MESGTLSRQLSRNNLAPHSDEPTLPTWRLIVLCISLCCGLFLSLLDTSIVATALYTICEEFSVSSAQGIWVALAYTLSYLGCAVLFTRVADIVGRRAAFTTAFAIFLACSIGCGAAQTLGQLVACRALQGIGGAGLYALTMVIAPEISPPRLAAGIGGVAGAVIALSGVMGPVLGGLITRYTTWRWIFFINAPIGVVPMILFYVAWPRPDQLRHAERRPLRELDVVGSVLLIAASVLVVFALQEGGLNADAWGTPIFIVPIVVGCVCWILLFGWSVIVDRYWDATIASIFPLRLIKRRVYMAGLLSATMMGFPYFVIIYSLPIRFQVVNQMSPLSAGLGLLPMLASAATGSLLGGAISRKKNWTFETLLFATCLMVLGTGLLSTLSPTADVEPKTYGFEVLAGLGFGLAVSTASMLAALDSPLRDHSVAQGIVAQNRILGGSIGIAASTAILSLTEVTQLLNPGVVSASQFASLEASAHALSMAQLEAIRTAYSDAFSADMRVSCIVAGISVLAAFGVYRRNAPSMEEMRRIQMEEEETRLAKLNGSGTATDVETGVEKAR